MSSYHLDRGPEPVPRRTHPVVQLRVDQHEEQNPEHELRHIESVSGSVNEWLCSCGAVFRQEEHDEELLQEYAGHLQTARELESQARKLEAEARNLRSKARGLLEGIS